MVYSFLTGGTSARRDGRERRIPMGATQMFEVLYTLAELFFPVIAGTLAVVVAEAVYTASDVAKWK